MPELIPAEPGTPEWHAARRQGVTATDIVAICGLSTWASAYSLYWQKLGQAPETPDSDRFRLGRYMEPYAVKLWQQDHPDMRASGSGKAWRHRERTWQMASPDRHVFPVTDPAEQAAVLEVKSWADADRPSWDAGPPPAVRAQVLWQMDVMDVPVGHVGVMFLPSGEFRSYTIACPCEDDDGSVCDVCADQELMRERGAEFYARLQGELPPPPVDASAATTAALKARFGGAAKGKRVPIESWLWTAYEEWKKDRDQCEAEVRRRENLIREQLGEATEIEVDGQLVARRRVYDSPVKAFTRHVDGFWRVKNGDDHA